MAKKQKTDGNDTSKGATAQAVQAAKQKLCAQKYPTLWQAIAALGLAFDEVEPKDVMIMSGLVRRITGQRSNVARAQRSANIRQRKAERLSERLAKNAAEKAKLEAIQAELGV